MSERYPRIRFYAVFDDKRYLRIRESICICFHMRRSHREVNYAVMRALDIYLRALGPQILGWYPDLNGDWQELDEKGWEYNRKKLLHPLRAYVSLAEQPNAVTGYEFNYQGASLEDLPWEEDPGVVTQVLFWLPTEYLEEHGPSRVRALALELASELPFNSGYAGLTFHFTEGVLGIMDPLHDLCIRYPGLDMPMTDHLPDILGTRIKGVHWVNFLGPPVLESLGGVDGLRSRLRSAGTSVEALGAERAVVTLGEWPEAGDREEGRTLPAYRELAHVLEPWLYMTTRSCWHSFSDEEVRRWQRRFLD